MVVPDASSRLPAAQAHLREHSRVSAIQVNSAAAAHLQKHSRASAIQVNSRSSEPSSDEQKKQRKSFRKHPPSSAEQIEDEGEAYDAHLPTRSEILQAQRDDYQCHCLIRRLRGLEESGPDTTEFLEETMKHGGEYHLQEPDGLLVYSSPKYQGVRVVIPPKLRVKLFVHFHLLCHHASFKKVYSLIASRYYFTGMYDTIRELSRRCIRCQAGKAQPRGRQGLLQNFPCYYPFQILVYDIFGPLPITVSGYRCILVVMDKFTRWVELIPLADTRAETIADALWEVVFSRFSFPERLLTENATNVHNNKLIQRLCARANVDKISSSFHHNATIAISERYNKFLAATLKLYTEQNAHSDWDKFLPGIAFASRVTFMSSVGTSSFQLLFNRPPTLPSDVLMGPQSEIEVDKKEYLLEQTGRMRDAYKLAISAQDKAEKYKKKYYDAHHEDVEYEVGDLVWLYTDRTKPGLAPKLAPKNSGPFEITSKLSPVSYIITDANGDSQRAHIQRLIPCYLPPGVRWKKLFIAHGQQHEPVRYQPVRAPSPVPPLGVPEKELTLMRKRRDPDTLEVQYLVKQGVQQNWFPADVLPEELVDQFELHARTKRASRRGRRAQ